MIIYSARVYGHEVEVKKLDLSKKSRLVNELQYAMSSDNHFECTTSTSFCGTMYSSTKKDMMNQLRRLYESEDVAMRSVTIDWVE
mgnify:CR=1 FL=1